MRLPAPFRLDRWRLAGNWAAHLARLYVERKLGRALSDHEYMIFRLPIIDSYRSKP